MAMLFRLNIKSKDTKKILFHFLIFCHFVVDFWQKCLEKCLRCLAGREWLSLHCSSDVWYFFSILRQNNRSKNIDTSLGPTKAWDLKAPPILQKNTKKIHFFSEFQSLIVGFKDISLTTLFCIKCFFQHLLSTHLKI